MGSHCTAGIEVEEDSTGLQVVYFKTHLGHTNNIGYLRISESDREAIAGKIASGVTFQKILDDVRDEVSDRISQLHLLTRHDLHNIKNAYNLQYESREHKLDPVSVELWVKNMAESVLLFKQQGVTDSTGNNFKDKDFMLVLMTNIQKELLIKFGKNTVCVDSTHGTNQYDFLLTTVLVIDEYGAGLPVAFCVSNNEDTETIKAYFTSIKGKTGVVTPKYLMSDDTSVYINAWTAVMGKPDSHLLCSWHVDKNWRKNLTKVTGGKEKQVLVYKAMRTLLEEADIQKFNELQDLLLKKLMGEEDTKRYGAYFAQYYASRTEVWAHCHRVGAGVNTNMHLEAMHRVLKYTYLDGKKNQRLDKLLGVLLKIVRDKCFERLVKLTKGKPTYKLSLIRERHKTGVAISSQSIKTICEGKVYKVDSQTNSNTTYTVEFVSQHCEAQCKLVCQDCNICIHHYTCTCPDSLLHHNMCKHIHAIAQKYKNISQNDGNVRELQILEDDFLAVENVMKTTEQQDINIVEENKVGVVKHSLDIFATHVQPAKNNASTLIPASGRVTRSMLKKTQTDGSQIQKVLSVSISDSLQMEAEIDSYHLQLSPDMPSNGSEVTRRRAFVSPLIEGSPTLRGSSSKKKQQARRAQLDEADKIAFPQEVCLETPEAAEEACVPEIKGDEPEAPKETVSTEPQPEVKVDDMERLKNVHESTKLELLEAAERWEKLIEGDPEIPENVAGDIHVAAGSVRLILGQKMKQFDDLVKQAESDNTVKIGDLEGFWGLVLVGVDGVRKQFSELEILRQNDWKNPSPIKKPRKAVKTSTPKSKRAATSKIKSLLTANRKKMKEMVQQDNEMENETAAEEAASPQKRNLRSNRVVLSDLPVIQNGAHNDVVISKTPLKSKQAEDDTCMQKNETKKGKAPRRSSTQPDDDVTEGKSDVAHSASDRPSTPYFFRTRKSSVCVNKTPGTPHPKESRPSLLPVVLLSPVQAFSTGDLIDFTTPQTQDKMAASGDWLA